MLLSYHQSPQSSILPLEYIVKSDSAIVMVLSTVVLSRLITNLAMVKSSRSSHEVIKNLVHPAGSTM